MPSRYHRSAANLYPNSMAMFGICMPGREPITGRDEPLLPPPPSTIDLRHVNMSVVQRVSRLGNEGKDRGHLAKAQKQKRKAKR